jgi:hypothetical protein
MRVKFLFWNIRQGKGRLLLDCLSRLAASDIDVFLIAEASSDTTLILDALNRNLSGQYKQVLSQSSRVLFFSRQNGPLFGAVWRDRYFDAVSNRITALECEPTGVLSILIIGAQLDSPYPGLSPEGRAELARLLANRIKTIEVDVGHTRTMVVGDLHMNPYDGGLVQTTALHAVMSRNLTEVVVRHEVRKGYPVFYNPMWSCYGDRPASRLQPRGRRRIPGTYYFDNTNDPANSFWQMFDQVLLRPELMDRLTYLEILAGDGTEDFVTSEGKPRGNLVSDHLPISFELHL